MSSQLLFISDLHLGHKRILEFSGEWREGDSVDEHDEWIIDQWNSIVGKRDSVYLLGDVAFSRDGLAKCARLKGHKNLILGNHDGFKVDEYQKYFKIRPGIFKHAGFWLSHAPVHPESLRGLRNIHGHMHHQVINDDRYINVCVEQVNGLPRSVQSIRDFNN